MHAIIHTAHRQVHKHLQLQHHKHTGQVLHHRHTSYRALAVVFVVAGVTMWGLAAMQRAAADALTSVSAVVPLPVPHASAIISTPADGAAIQSSDTLVAGNCPVMSPALTIVVLVDGNVAGSALCGTNNDFALPVRLAPGNHTLVTQTYTVTGGQGPDSPAIGVTYQARNGVAGAKNPASINLIPVLIPDEPFDLVGANNAAQWNGHVSGGTAPYRVTVDWGDGKRASYTTADGQLQYTHQYTAGTSHRITVAVADAGNQFAQLQYAAVNYLAIMNTPAALLNTPMASGRPNARMLAGLYGLYITVLAGSGIIWIEAKHAARHEAVDAQLGLS
jgi:hypothetical protein